MEGRTLLSGIAMFSKSIVRVQSVAALALICQFFVITECDAQQNDQSLFVIKAPTVVKSGYGQQPKAITFAPISFSSIQETTPREDEGSEAVPDEPNLKPFDDLKVDNDVLEMDDETDFSNDEPPRRPMTQWNLKPMSAIVPSIRNPAGKSPTDLSGQLTNRGSMPHASSDKLFAWAAPDIRYKPLFFEDVALERYGQTRGLYKQPFVSGFNYLKSATLLPYFSIYDPIDACDGPLGYCRPGDNVNCVSQKHFFGNPFSRRSTTKRLR